MGELAGTARRHILSLAAPAAAAAAPKPQILLQPSAAHPPSSLPPPPPMLLTIPPLHFIIRLLSGHLPALDTTRCPDLSLWEEKGFRNWQKWSVQPRLFLAILTGIGRRFAS